MSQVIGEYKGDGLELHCCQLEPREMISKLFAVQAKKIRPACPLWSVSLCQIINDRDNAVTAMLEYLV